MEDAGPLYTVKMQLGQGFNSFIQEPCIDNAVTRKWVGDGVNGPPSAPATAHGAVTGNSRKSKIAEGDESDESAGGPVDQELTNILRHLSKNASSQNAVISTFLDFMASMESRKVAPEPSPASPKPPYNFKPDEAAQPNQNVIFSSRQVDKTSDINDVLGISSSAAIKAGGIGIGGEVGGSLATEKELKDSDLNFFVSVKVVNEGSGDDDPPTWVFNRIPKLRELLVTGANNDEANDERTAYFTRVYGDTFISDFVVGGELYALVRIKLRDRKKLADVRAYASAQLTPPSSPLTIEAKADAHRSGREAFDQSEVFIRVQWRGGGEIKTHDNQWGLEGLVKIANAFPSLVAIKSARIRAVLTPYSSLKSFQDWIHETNIDDALKLSNMVVKYDLCSVYVETLYADFNAFGRLCADIDEMINHIDDYEARKKQPKEDRSVRPRGPRLRIRGYESDSGQDDGSDEDGRGANRDSNTKGKEATASSMEYRRQMSRSRSRSRSRLRLSPPSHQRESRNLKASEEDFTELDKPEKLAEMRHLCRSSMLFIRQEIMDIAENPRRVRLYPDPNSPNMKYSIPDYTFPAKIAARLPVVRSSSRLWSQPGPPPSLTTKTQTAQGRQLLLGRLHYARPLACVAAGDA